jgi:acyl-CoA thioester hydrolase
MSVSTVTLRVRYAETDQMGIVYHANYFIWCEIGRVELLRSLGFDYKQMEIDDDCHLPVAEATCRYKSPARYDDQILLEARVTALRRSIVKFGYRLFCANDGDRRLLAEAETIHVVVNREMKTRTLPEKYLTALREAMEKMEMQESSRSSE